MESTRAPHIRETENVVDSFTSSVMDAPMLASFLHENYPSFYDEILDVCEVAHALSDCEILGKTKVGAMRVSVVCAKACIVLAVQCLCGRLCAIECALLMLFNLLPLLGDLACCFFSSFSFFNSRERPSYR